jgi:hypothetical protein
MLARETMGTRKFALALALIAALVAGVVWLGRSGADTRESSAPIELLARVARKDVAPNALASAPDSAQRTSEQFAAASAAIVAPAQTAPALVAHPRMHRIVRGRVLDASGAAVELARVRCALVDREYPSHAEWGELAALAKAGQTRSPVLESATDSNGAFEFRDPAAGRLLIEVEAAGFEPLQCTRLVPARMRETDVGTLSLSAGVRLSGRVEDELGRPLAGARVSRTCAADWTLGFWSNFAYVELARTDAQGVFEASSLPRPPWNLLVEHEDCLSSAFELERAPSAGEPLRVVLRRGLQLAGTVAAQDGVEPSELRVHARPKSGAYVPREVPGDLRLDGDCDATGAFRIARIPAGLNGVPLELSVTHRGGWVEELAAPVLAFTGEEHVRLQLAQPSWLEFGSRDAATGQPLLELELVHEFSVAGEQRPLGGQRLAALALETPGRFRARLPMVFPPGAVQRVHIRPAEHESYWTAPIEPGPGRRVELGWLDFAAVVGQLVRVHDALTGAPIAGANVIVADEQALDYEPFAIPRYALLEQGGFYTQPHSVQSTDADGRTRVALRSGTAFLAVAHRGYRTSEARSASAEAAVEQLEIELHPGGTAVFQVVWKQVPVAPLAVLHECIHASVGERMAVNLGSESQGAASVDSAGRAVFERLAPGVHRFRVSTSNAAPLELRVEEDGFHEALLSAD